MQRIVRGLSATLSHVFYSDGVATNPSPDAATVTITRDDGTPVVTDAAASEAGTGVVTYTLTPAQTATLDRLTVAWTATFGGQAQTFTDVVEVAGDVLFTINQARTVKPLDNATLYTVSKIVEKRTLVESLLEHACGVAFVPRYSKVILSGNGRSTLMLPPRTTAIRSVRVDGVAVAQSYIDTMRLLNTGELYYPSFWGQGYANYEVAFEHGFSDGAERMAATDAALTWVKALLVSGPVDDRMTSMSTDDGTFSLSTPGLRGAVAGIPSVDAFIQNFDLNVAVA